MSYTNVFSDNELPPSDVGLAIYSITANTALTWPSYASPNALPLASIVELSSTDAFTLTLPPANQVSVGESVLFLNTGAYALSFTDVLGGAVFSLTAGAAYLLYVKDNSSGAGVWRSLAYGVGTSTASAAALAGNGLQALSAKLALEVTAVVLNSNFTAVDSNRAKLLLFTGGATTLTLEAIGSLSGNFYCHVKNNGTGTITVQPSGGNTIDGAATLTIQPAESCTIMSDGANAWVTVGLGRSTVYQYSNLTLDVSAGGSFTLTSAQAANKLLTFVGNPTDGVSVVVPGIVGVYYVVNNLSTVQSVQIKTESAAGTSVAQSQRAVVLCDGIRVTSAQTAPTTSIQSLLDGTVVAPSLNFVTKTNTGLYKFSTKGLGLTVDGKAQLTSNGAGVEVPLGLTQGGVPYKTSNTGSFVMPAGTTAQRDGSPQPGYDRFNTTIGKKEYWNGSDWIPVSGALAGFRNILINGDMRINQRGVTIAAAANGAYGPDRWKKVDASNMTQIVEAGNFEPSTVYTLSGTEVTTQQITSPASGNWTLPNIPIAATKIQLEKGSIATPFEPRPIGLELALCQRYYEGSIGSTGYGLLAESGSTHRQLSVYFKTSKRATPTITAAFNTAGGGAQYITKDSFEAFINLGTTSGGAYLASWTASAEL